MSLFKMPVKMCHFTLIAITIFNVSVLRDFLRVGSWQAIDWCKCLTKTLYMVGSDQGTELKVAQHRLCSSCGHVVLHVYAFWGVDRDTKDDLATLVD